MRKNKLLTLLIGVCLVLALVAVPFMSACAPEVVEEEEEEEIVEEVKWATIGIVMPLTGPVGYWGFAMEQGMLIAIDGINEAGGFLVNGQRYMLKLESFDERYDAKLDVAGATAMVERGIKLMVGPPTPAGVIAASPILWEHKALMLTAQAAAAIKKANLPNYFMLETNEERAGVIADYVTEGLGADTMGFAMTNIVFDLEQIEFGTPALKAKGCEAVITEIIELGTEDFYTIIAKIREADPDFVLMSGSQTETALFLRQRMELNYPVQCVSMDSLSVGGAPIFKIAGAAGADGHIGSAVFFEPGYEWADWEVETMGLDLAELASYTQRSLEKYGLDWYSANQGFGYAYIQVFVDVMQRAGTVTDGEALFAAMETLNLPTVLFTYHYSPGVHNAVIPRIWVQEYVVDEVTGEFRTESVAGSKPLDPYGHEWETYIHKELNIDDIRAGIVPGTASYGNPY